MSIMVVVGYDHYVRDKFCSRGTVNQESALWEEIEVLLPPLLELPTTRTPTALLGSSLAPLLPQEYVLGISRPICADLASDSPL